MRVLVTGASGGIGSAVVPELVSAGHEVVGLARSERSAGKVTDLGGTPLIGELTDLDVIRTAAQQADGAIHLAFSNDFSNLGPGIEQEAAAVAAIGEVFAGSDQPFVVAGGTPIVPGRLATEDDPNSTEGPVGGRGVTQNGVLALAEKGVRSSLVRLPRSVHLRGSAYGFASMVIAHAQHTGVAAFVGDGSQRWPAVNRLDAATLFRIALEDAEPGAVLHAVGDEGDSMRSIAEAIGGVLGLPVEQVAPEQYGPLGGMFGLDMPATSEQTRARYGWQPSHPGLLEDLRAGGYPAQG